VKLNSTQFVTGVKQEQESIIFCSQESYQESIFETQERSKSAENQTPLTSSLHRKLMATLQNIGFYSDILVYIFRG